MPIVAVVVVVCVVIVAIAGITVALVVRRAKQKKAKENEKSADGNDVQKMSFFYHGSCIASWFVPLGIAITSLLFLLIFQ